MSPLSILVYVSALPYIIKVLTILYQHLHLTKQLEPALMDTPSRNQHSSIETLVFSDSFENGDRNGNFNRRGHARWNEPRNECRKPRLHDYELCQGS